MVVVCLTPEGITTRKSATDGEPWAEPAEVLNARRHHDEEEPIRGDDDD